MTMTTTTKRKTAAKPRPKPAKKRATNSAGASPWRKVLIWSAAILGALALSALLLAWLTFSSYRDLSAPQLGEPHYLLLRRLATMMRSNRKLKEATLRLSPQEVDQLFDIVRHASQFVPERQMPPPRSFMLRYRDDGGVFVSAPAPVAGEWCFGGKVYVSGLLYFEKQEDEVIVDMPRLSFGRADVPIPGGLDTVYPSWKKELKEALPAEFMTAVKSLHSERDGSVVLVYRPQELRRPLKKQLSKVEERCSGELKLPLGQLIKSL